MKKNSTLYMCTKHCRKYINNSQTEDRIPGTADIRKTTKPAYSDSTYAYRKYTGFTLSGKLRSLRPLRISPRPIMPCRSALRAHRSMPRTRNSKAWCARAEKSETGINTTLSSTPTARRWWRNRKNCNRSSPIVGSRSGVSE